MAQKTVRLHPLVEGRAKTLDTALRAGFGVTGSQEEIVNALLYCATPALLVGMLAEFNRAVESAQTVSPPASEESTG